MRYGFIKAAVEKDKTLRVARLCKILEVSKTGYYAWDKRPESNRKRKQRKLTLLVKNEFFENKQIPGAKKIAAKLSSVEEPVNTKAVAKIMRENHWKSKTIKKYKATTNSKHDLPVAENILNRDFSSDAPNNKWVSDITYIATDEGWLYLAGILDLCGRKVVGWSMGERMTKRLVIDCLKQALMRRGNPKGVLLHSDRGSQYCSREYRDLLSEHDFICSMSRKGNCWDNAPMESFWGKLKQEYLNDFHFRTREEAKKAVFWYIEIYHRHYRLHESNGYKRNRELFQAIP